MKTSNEWIKNSSIQALLVLNALPHALSTPRHGTFGLQDECGEFQFTFCSAAFLFCGKSSEGLGSDELHPLYAEFSSALH